MRYRLATASSVQTALKKLRDEDLVVEADRKYRISDRFFGLWIRQYML
jgi:predicted transcriptional regulator